MSLLVAHESQRSSQPCSHPRVVGDLKRPVVAADSLSVDPRHHVQTDTPEPSGMWRSLAWAALVLAAVALIVSWGLVAEAQRPIGEGELFLADAARASDLFGTSTAPAEDRVRMVRNDLMIEAVSVLQADMILASTSPTLVGQAPSSPLLTGLLADGRFGAVAAGSPAPVSIDGVQVWEAGDVLYDVVQPLPDGTGLLLTYDLSELLRRRSAAKGVPATALGWLAIAGVLAAVGTITLVARARAEQRFRELGLQARFLEEQAETLAVHNRELEEARKAAERALALAEETNRIRSEFVLMINHEFRTPLTGVVTGSRLMAELDLPTEAQSLLADVVDDGERLEHLMAQMLAVARVENRGLFFEAVATPLESVLTAISTVPSQPEVLFDWAPAPAVSVMTDNTTIAQLTASLAANALQHGASKVRVSWAPDLPFEPDLEVGSQPQAAVFVLVADDGPGIDRHFLPRIFEKFEKRSFSSGTGLGLYLARLMADALSASISVETSSKGTTMAIGLPVAGSDQK